jgi:glycosyltransferase involved in cell wall biosynthesis
LTLNVKYYLTGKERMMILELTIAIITKNRVPDLRKCLTSLYRQTQNNFVVLIVDNDCGRSAQSVYEYFKSKNERLITYYCEPEAGYTNARNCALINCQTRYIGFVDDDCVLNANWAASGLEAIKYHHSAFVVGRTEQMQCKSIFADVERYIYINWMPEYFDKQTYEMNPLRVDTKNVIFDRRLLKKNNIRFDGRFNEYGGEDVDLGLELKHCGLKGYFVHDMLSYHKGKSCLKSYIKKAFAYGYNCCNLYYKWRRRNECADWNNLDSYRLHLSFKRNLYELYGIKQNTKWKKVSYFILIKLFNMFFLKGYVTKRRLVLKNGNTCLLKSVEISECN